MRKRPIPHAWPYVVGVIAVIAVLTWVQFSIKSLGNELEQTRSDNAALAAQVRSLGGQPVAEGVPGARGDQGPMGPQGIQGPPGPRGIQGPIGITGESPQCLLMPSRCVGPTGGAGQAGKPGAAGGQGAQGEPGATGATGDPGPAGADGKDGAPGAPGQDGVDGKDGMNGADGTDGRGIKSVTCQSDGTWLITYTEGPDSTTEGPCRVSLLGN